MRVNKELEKLDNLIDSNRLHPSNIFSHFSNNGVLKFDKSKDFNEIHP